MCGTTFSLKATLTLNGTCVGEAVNTIGSGHDTGHAEESVLRRYISTVCNTRFELPWRLKDRHA